MKHIFKYWAPLCLYAGIIFYMSSLSHPLPSISIPYFDKFIHIVEYSIFGILAARALKNSPRVVFNKNFIMFAVLITVAYGASDEFHQIFVPFRACDIFDLTADLIGGTIGSLIYSIKCTSLRVPTKSGRSNLKKKRVPSSAKVLWRTRD